MQFIVTVRQFIIYNKLLKCVTCKDRLSVDVRLPPVRTVQQEQAEV